ncbi:unnamed protein product [Amoebophrya sp. A25]|nr:unnamed protein product [Amoebophrya sp. A25]|eukprot:GSA25T00015869001.1
MEVEEAPGEIDEAAAAEIDQATDGAEGKVSAANVAPPPLPKGNKAAEMCEEPAQFGRNFPMITTWSGVVELSDKSEKDRDLRLALKSMTVEEWAPFWSEVHAAVVPIFEENEQAKENTPQSLNLALNNVERNADGSYQATNDSDKQRRAKERKKVLSALERIWSIFILTVIDFEACRGADFPLSVLHCGNLLQPQLPNAVFGEETYLTIKARARLADAIQKLIQNKCESYEVFLPLFAQYVVDEATKPPSDDGIRIRHEDRVKQQDVNRLWEMREIFRILDLEANASSHVKQRLNTCLTEICFYRGDGPKFLQFLITMSPNAAADFDESLYNILPTRTPNQIKTLSEVYLDVWKRWDAQARKNDDSESAVEAVKSLQDFERRLQNWMLIALQGNKEAHKTALAFLRPFHKNRSENEYRLNDMLVRLWSPLLWRNLQMPNAIVRAQATSVFAMVFPLTSSGMNKDELEEKMQKHFKHMRDLLEDKDSGVRFSATQMVCKVLASWWSVVPNNEASALLEKIAAVGRDKGCPENRAVVASSLKMLITEEPQAHDSARHVLKYLSMQLHDTAPKVRQAFVELLLVVKKDAKFQIQDVVTTQDLLHRIAFEYTNTLESGTPYSEDQKANSNRIGNGLATIVRPSLLQSEEVIPVADRVERLYCVLDKFPLAVLAVFKFTHFNELQTQFLSELAAEIMTRIHKDPPKVTENHIACMGAILRLIDCERVKKDPKGTKKLEAVTVFFSDESIVKLLNLRPDLQASIIDMSRYIPTRGPKIEKAFKRNLREMPRLLGAGDKFEQFGMVFECFVRDCEKLASFWNGGCRDETKLHLERKEVRIYSMLLKNPAIREKLAEKKEALIPKGRELVEAFGKACRKRHPRIFGDTPSAAAPPPNTTNAAAALIDPPNLVVLMLRIASELILRLDSSDSSFGTTRSPVPKLVPNLLAWATPEEELATAEAASSNGSSIRRNWSAPEDSEECFPLMIEICTAVMENLAFLNVFTPTPNYPKLATEVGQLLWWLASKRLMEDESVLNNTWQFLQRCRLRQFRPCATEAVAILEDVLDKVGDRVGSDEDLRTLWASILMKFSVSPAMHDFLRRHMDDKEMEAWLVPIDEPEPKNRDSFSSLEEIPPAEVAPRVPGRMTQEAFAENESGEKLFTWHRRITDCLYSQAPKFKALYKILYLPKPDGSCGPILKHPRKGSADSNLDEFFNTAGLNTAGDDLELKDDDLMKGMTGTMDFGPDDMMAEEAQEPNIKNSSVQLPNEQEQPSDDSGAGAMDVEDGEACEESAAPGVPVVVEGAHTEQDVRMMADEDEEMHLPSIPEAVEVEEAARTSKKSAMRKAPAKASAKVKAAEISKGAVVNKKEISTRKTSSSSSAPSSSSAKDKKTQQSKKSSNTKEAADSKKNSKKSGKTTSVEEEEEEEEVAEDGDATPIHCPPTPKIKMSPEAAPIGKAKMAMKKETPAMKKETPVMKKAGKK